MSRRGLIRAGWLTAAGLGAVFAGRRAHGDIAVQPRRLDDLARLQPGPTPLHVPGQGWFAAAPADGTEPDGILRLPGPDGSFWQRLDFDGIVDPAWFATDADGDDDAPMIQRAADHAERYGPFAIGLGSRRYMCMTALTIDPTRVALQGTGAILDFSRRPEPVVTAPLASLSDIAPDLGWTRQQGILSRDAGPATTLIHFLSLPDAGRYRIAFTVGALRGDVDYPSVTVSLSGARREAVSGVTAIASGTYMFEVEGPLTAARLTIETAAAVTIDSLTVTAQDRRECILIRATQDSPQYGHKWMSGIDVKGPGHGTALDGLRFETLIEAQSSRLALRDVTVRGFQTGLVLSHRSYLIHATGLRCACDIGLHVLGGLQDAGELISLYASVIDGGRIAILNEGAEITLFGTAIDFVDQVVVGSGRVTLQGCHLEVNRPKAADMPLIDLSWGDVTLIGGSFGVTGAGFDDGNQCDYIFHLRARAATALMRDVQIYNLRSQSGALAGGPGRLDVERVVGRRRRHMAPIVQFDPARNLLGPMPLDLRTSAAADGTFERFPTDAQSFKVSAAYRYVWLVGRTGPGVELGAAFQVRSDTPGTITAQLQALDGDRRVPIGDAWPVTVTADWQTYRNNSGDTHPSASTDGRMPSGCSEVALMLDLSSLTGTVEVADIFLSAV